MKYKKYIIMAAIFIVGLVLLLCPLLFKPGTTLNVNSLTASYDRSVGEDCTAERENAQRYNATLKGANINDLLAAYDNNVDERYTGMLNPCGNGMMAYVEIPEIEVKLPIFHHQPGNENTEGLVHLAGSSMPVGGAGTHAVFSSHSSKTINDTFLGIEKLENGARIYVHSLDEILVYVVDSVAVVDPGNIEALGIEGAYDFVTLVADKGAQRIFVRAIRVPFDEIQYNADVK